VDGTENPPMGAASQYALIADGPGAAGSVLLLQRWDHDALAWESLGADGQARVMGRTKDTNKELEDKSPTSHIARNDQDEIGQILRRNIAYGDLGHHGTLFVGLCGTQTTLHEMLRRMVGADGGGRDDLTRYTTPVTGAYYFLSSATDLQTRARTAAKVNLARSQATAYAGDPGGDAADITRVEDLYNDATGLPS
jgi:putative iron-dependent peroxidase